ncbi:10111_t:CDS:1, partial [Funneliformis caledonium]
LNKSFTLFTSLTTVVKTPTLSENRKSHSGGDSTTSSSALSSQTSQQEEAEDKVNLTLLLVSGKRHTFVFDPNDTITVVKSRVFNNWPK